MGRQHEGNKSEDLPLMIIVILSGIKGVIDKIFLPEDLLSAYFRNASLPIASLKTNKDMILTVIKRDGRIVGFNREKIAAAIRKAMLTTENGEDEVLVYKIVDRIEYRGKKWLRATLPIAISEALPARPRHAKCSLKSWMPNRMTSLEKTPT